MERTFCIIKPDAVARNLQGEILAMIMITFLQHFSRLSLEQKLHFQKRDLQEKLKW